MSHENKSKHHELSFASFFLISISRFLPLCLLSSIWINATSFGSLLFSLWLFIYFNYIHGYKRHAEWPLTAMSNISFCQIWLFSLAAVTWCLYASLRVQHDEKRGVWAERVTPQEGSFKKYKKRARARDGWNRGREKSRKGLGGTPAGSQASRLAAPSWLQTSFVKEGKRGSLLHLGIGQKMFCLSGKGCLWGVWMDAERGIKPKTHLHKGWGGGRGQPIGAGQMLKRGWFIILGVLGGTWPPSQI